jgi:hypothetical protein
MVIYFRIEKLILNVLIVHKIKIIFNFLNILKNCDKGLLEIEWGFLFLFLGYYVIEVIFLALFFYTFDQ